MKYYFIILGWLFLAISCSSPGERTASQVMAISISDTSRQANCVSLTGDEKDQPVISWSETEQAGGGKSFYMAFLNEKNDGFSDRISIPLEQNVSLHEEGMPKLAFKADGTIIAIYEVAVNSEKNRFAGLVRYIVSTDKGKSWTKPASLHSDRSLDNSHSFAAITRLSDGELGACWLDQALDPKIQGRPVKFAKTNGDNRFHNEQIIDSVACQCCRIAMSGSEGGRLAIAFRDIINDSIRDMSIITSSDNGKTFNPAVPFSNDGWIINGCPHNGPSLAQAGSSVYATWFTGGPERGVYYGELNNKNEMVNKKLVSDRGRFAQLCLLRDGSRVLVYNENVQEDGKSYNKILLNKIQQDKIFEEELKLEKSMAGYPVVRSFGPGNIVVAWTSNGKVYYQVKNAADISTPVNTQLITIVAKTPRLSNIKLAASTDLVCGMPLSLSPTDTTLFGDKVYGFCSEICKNNFSQKPASFLQKLKK